LARQETQDEIKAIFAATPKSFADDKIVVNGDHYTQGYRDNLLRIWNETKVADPKLETYVLECARNAAFWNIQDLMDYCNLPGGKAFGVILRLIGRRLLGVNWNAFICPHSRVWLA
jgi:hypothetical protein